MANRIDPPQEKIIPPFFLMILSSILPKEKKGSWAMVVAMVAGGIIGNISGRIVFIGVFIVQIFSVILSLLLKDVSDNAKQENAGGSLWDDFRIYSSTLRDQKKRLQLFISFAVYITIVSIYFLFGQQTFDEMGVSRIFIGMIYAGAYFASGLGNNLSHLLEKKISTRNILKIIFVFSGILFGSLLFPNPYIYMGIFIAISILFGIAESIIITVINEKFPSDKRVALNSTFNFLSSFIMFVLGPLLGAISLLPDVNMGILIAISGGIFSLKVNGRLFNEYNPILQ